LEHRLIFTGMNLKDGSSVTADLTTIGRKSGLPRTVELRFVYQRGCFYASSSRIQGKHWCQNMLKHPAVEITVTGEKFSCTARQVTDNNLRKEVLTARGSSRDMDRIVFEIKPRLAAE
jgi:deazaflavin-dependent oxidoreductase (nitroreductase family)